LAFAVGYTVLPIIVFLVVDFHEYLGWQRLADLLPSSKDMARHLWRHDIFILGIGTGYLLFRGKKTAKMLPTKKEIEAGNWLFILIFIIIILVSMAGVSFLSAPVSSYIDHYKRFDNLSWISLRIVYVLMALKAGSYYVLLYYLFANYQKYKLILWPIIVAICYYEFSYSYGTRIEIFAIIMAALGFYQQLVRSIQWRRCILLFIGIAMLFSLLEYIRSARYNGTPSEQLTTSGIAPAAEFSAVLFTGFHLYSERERNSLPDRPWPMFFSDVIFIIPFADHIKWHPQYWYARNYYPDAIVPPETMGPIADSALWGGELDLMFRGFVNGAFYGLLVGLLIGRKSIWWRHITYIYTFATCIMSLKYSIFYSLPLFLQNLLLALIVAGIIKKMLLHFKHKACPMKYRIHQNEIPI
jgi:hypothetical protein